MLTDMRLRSFWPVAVAIVLGFLLIPVINHEYHVWSAQRDMAAELSRPVVRMAGTLLERRADDVLLKITGEKLRPCKYAGISAFTLDVTGVRRAASIERVAPIPQTTSTLPVGAYDFGIWRVWPVYGEAAVLLVYVEHVCGAVAVQTLAAEVRL